jgi:hypothetical protein
MSAIITDQLRILNAQNFLAGVASTSNSYYTFVGLPNASEVSSTWNSSPPDPRDNFDQENDYWDTMIALKKITPSDVRPVIRKVTWQSGITYDMYRHDIRAENRSKPSNAFSLYDANYYVMNSDYRVYICLHNGTSPDYPEGRPSLDEPTFIDLEPREAGSSGDGYVWKYLYTIRPSDIIKFDTTNFMPVPLDWSTSAENSSVRENAKTSGQIKIVTIVNRGVGVGTANRTYTKVPIKGDGTGAEAIVTVNNDQKVESVTVSNGGNGYTYGILDLAAGGIPTPISNPVFNVIIPPQGGHGADIYRELGSKNVLIYSRIENDTSNPDFIVGNEISRIGIVENPKVLNSSTDNLTLEKASAVYAVRLTGVGYSSASFDADSYITQTVGLGSTAVGRVISYDQTTGVLKYWQDRTLAGFNTDGSLNPSPIYGTQLHRFTGTPAATGSITVVGSASTLAIHTSFSGLSTVINNRTYYLGQEFINGISQPEVQKYSGNIIYVDNRPSITRSQNQKEDIKIILQF